MSEAGPDRRARINGLAIALVGTILLIFADIGFASLSAAEFHAVDGLIAAGAIAIPGLPFIFVFGPA